MAMKTGFLFMSMALLQVLAKNVSEARDFQTNQDVENIVVRLEGPGGGIVECWNALYELKSCTNEIITFLINGQTSLGRDCCGAVHVITHNCWPAMLTSLGFTAEEGNVLKGYCDSPTSAHAPAPLEATKG